METPKKIAFRLPRQIAPDYSWGTQSVQYVFVTVGGEDGENAVRNPSDYGKLAPYNNLKFRCQFSADMNEGKPYAYSLEYRDCGGIGLAEVERMAKMLKRIAKITGSFPVQPESFGQFVQLVCLGLKIDLVVKDGNGNGWHTETEHQTWKVSEIQWLVDRQISEFYTEHKERMAVKRW